MTQTYITVNAPGGEATLHVDDHVFTYRDLDTAKRAYEFVVRPESEGVHECLWIVDRHRRFEMCRAPAVTTDRGWSCFDGHGHVNLEVRAAEGWDYADEDELEAHRNGEVLGYNPVPMNTFRGGL